MPKPNGMLKTRWLQWFSAIVNLHIIKDGELPEQSHLM
jgi:1-acyl-sn-glycerol-3-phosphate acyltransferase